MKTIKEEAAKIADTAAGQKAFIRSEIPVPEQWVPGQVHVEKMKLQIIRIAVEAYIDEAEQEKTRMLKRVEVEQAKNRHIKEIAEDLARELERVSPGHQLANDSLALLLEDQMMTNWKSKYVRRKTQ